MFYIVFIAVCMYVPTRLFFFFFFFANYILVLQFDLIFIENKCTFYILSYSFVDIESAKYHIWGEQLLNDVL